MLALELVLRKDEAERGAAIYGKLECLRFSIYSQSYKPLSIRMQISPILTPPSCLAPMAPLDISRNPTFVFIFNTAMGIMDPFSISLKWLEHL